MVFGTRHSEMLLTCKMADSLRSLRLVAQLRDYIKPATVQTLRTPAPGSRAVPLTRRADRNHHLEHLAPDRPTGERHRALRPPAAG